jgi:hypothetical protein
MLAARAEMPVVIELFEEADGGTRTPDPIITRASRPAVGSVVVLADPVKSLQSRRNADSA